MRSYAMLLSKIIKTFFRFLIYKILNEKNENIKRVFKNNKEFYWLESELAYTGIKRMLFCACIRMFQFGEYDLDSIKGIYVINFPLSMRDTFFLKNRKISNLL